MQENRNAARQRQDDAVKSTNQKINNDRTLAGNYRSDDRVDVMRRNRTQREVEAEYEMQRKIEEVGYSVFCML